MKYLIAIAAIVFASPAIAGVCNGVGNYTHCSGDDGSQTNIQRNGDYYQFETRDNRGNVKSGGYWNYNDDKGDDR